MAISEFSRRGKKFRFLVENPKDTIQRCHERGFFYEEDELQDIKLSLPNDAVVLDVGANVGNHTIYFAHLTGASKVLPVECNPLAIAILNRNIELNPTEKIDTRAIGVALGSSPGFCELGLKEHLQDNLGATAVTRVGAQGSIRVQTGDSLFGNEARVDFVKIDVEGFEFEVLGGISELVSKFQPVIYVEVADVQRCQLKIWLKDASYRVDRTHMRHRGVRNYLCHPW